jgi:hypothetical protein
MSPIVTTPVWTPAAELKVNDPAIVEVLWHPTKRVHLKPFLGASAGLAEAAEMLGVKKTAMSYWIDKLLALGLIRGCGHDPRSRRKLPIYRCIADRLRLSLGDAPMASLEGVFDDMDARWHPRARAALARALARQAPWMDLTIEITPRGGMSTNLVPNGDAKQADDFVYNWGRLWLTAAERDGLRGELNALYDKYSELTDAVNKPYPVLMHLVAVPDLPR